MNKYFFFAQMTPSKEELPPQPLRDEDNYDISNIRSDEDTDDEDHPRKVVPRWASGIEFRTLLLRQAFLPPDLDAIFSEVGPIGKIPFLSVNVSLLFVMEIGLSKRKVIVFF